MNFRQRVGGRLSNWRLLLPKEKDGTLVSEGLVISQSFLSGKVTTLNVEMEIYSGLCESA